MYQEYAIDPTSICGSFDRFKLFWNGLGYNEGRLLSRFPSSWEKKVVKSRAYRELPDGLRKKAIEESLAKEAKIKRRSILSGRDFNSNADSWLEEAERAHASLPFYSIISEENPRSHKDVACFDDIGEPGDCWEIPKPWQVARYHKDMARAAAPLLRSSREILLIEPYFDFKDRFTRPLKSFLTELAPYSTAIKRIEVHLKHWDNESNDELFVEAFKQRAAESPRHFVPDENGDAILEKLEFIIWESPDSNRMHPRYILTEIAGLGFENGLDESDNGGGITDISIIAGTSLEARWDEFQATTSIRRLISRIHARDLT
ncbi:MAG TPA: hypothetical protein DEA90_13580 [Opitutae bacterium]|nr:hypothetical protein [Puniceicoccaceae bacterium]HBR95186.1 hypothetical protein [Opitutae bacterium]|tara:strand:- start:1758 stop:2708 length:951 start_codon:yes stop_codon:yes gene_type:complete